MCRVRLSGRLFKGSANCTTSAVAQRLYLSKRNLIGGYLVSRGKLCKLFHRYVKSELLSFCRVLGVNIFKTVTSLLGRSKLKLLFFRKQNKKSEETEGEHTRQPEPALNKVQFYICLVMLALIVCSSIFMSFYFV